MWTINAIPVDEFEGVSLRLANQSAAELRLTLAVPSDAPARFAFGTELVLRNSAGVVQFRGTVRSPRDARETGRESRQILAASDAWARLERCTWTMDYPFDTALGAPDTRVLIGGRWERVEITDPISEEEGAFEEVIDIVPIDVATSLRAAIGQTGVEIAEMGLGGIIPPIQADGITVANVIRSVARLFPGAVAFIDPASGKIALRRASAMPVVSVALTDCLERRVLDRPDLVLPGAALHVRKVRSSDGGQEETLAIFSAGDAGHPEALRVAVEAQPETHALEIQYLRMQPTAALAFHDLNWWADVVPWVKTAREQPERYTLDALKNPRLEIPDNVILAAEYNNVIVAGNVSDAFLLYGCAGPYDRREPVITTHGRPHVVPNLVRASASAEVLVFRTVGSDGTRLGTWEPLNVSFLFTDLEGSGRYAWEDTAALDPGEDPATYAALPAQFLAETQRLRYEGSIRLKTENPARYMGAALNLTGDAPEWAAMAAPVHTVEYDVQLGEATVEFGSAGYLGLADLVAIMEALKHERPKRRRSTRYGLPPLTTPRNAGTVAQGPPPGPAAGQTTPELEPGEITLEITPESAIEAGANWTALLEGGQSYGPFVSEEVAALPPGKYTILLGACDGHKPPPKIETQQVYADQKTTIDKDLCKYKVLPAPVTLPFAFEVRQKVDAQGEPTEEWEGRVAPGELRLSRRFGDVAPITNLGTWAPIGTFPTMAWIKATFDREGVLTEALIDGDGGTDTFDPALEAWELESYCEDDGDEETDEGPVHKITRLVLARVTRSGELPPVVEQFVFGHLSILDGIVDGRPAQVLEAV